MFWGFFSLITFLPFSSVLIFCRASVNCRYSRTSASDYYWLPDDVPSGMVMVTLLVPAACLLLLGPVCVSCSVAFLWSSSDLSSSGANKPSGLHVVGGICNSFLSSAMLLSHVSFMVWRANSSQFSSITFGSIRTSISSSASKRASLPLALWSSSLSLAAIFSNASTDSYMPWTIFFVRMVMSEILISACSTLCSNSQI